MLVYLPLLVAVGIVGAFLLVPRSRWLNAVVSRLSFSFFDGRSVESDYQRERLLRTAAIGTPYRQYVTKTYLYVFGTAIAGALVGVYVGFVVLALLESFGVPTDFGLPSLGVFTNLPDLSWLPSPETIRSAIPSFDSAAFVILLLSSAVCGVLFAGGAYFVRWQLPSIRADTRRRQIDAGMPRMVAFIYALSRGGMAFPDVLRSLSRNESVFGEGASEVGVAVRNMDLFNVDLITAIQDTAERSPSEQFEQFGENLGSVLQSGRNVSDFLRDQYERYRDEAEEQQREILDLLATTAEVYVTVVVAGLLFLITILLIIGLTVGNTLTAIQVLTYVIIPATNVLFIAYLAEITQPLRATRDRRTVEETAITGGRESVSSESGYTRPFSRRNHGRFRAHEQLRSIRRTLASPIQSVIERPKLLLYVTVPLAVLVTAYRLPSVIVDGTLQLDRLDTLLVQAAIFLMGTFAVVYEVSSRRSRRIENGVPDFLERLASLNEAGISVVSSFKRVRDSDIGSLDEEADRIWRDIQWGATVTQALDRFENRVRAPSVTRVVTLINNSMRASNDIGPVLRIAAEQARSEMRLRRQRKQEMLTYLVVIYVAFLVFLIVIIALDAVLIPNLPDAGAVTGEAAQDAPGVIGGFEGGDRDSYRLVFFHAALIQSALSGIVGGMMGGGSIKDGAKHATVMLTITFVILTFLG